MKEIKEVEYDDINTWNEGDAVCPYCGYRHEMIGEDYGAQDEELELECSSCDKIFIYTTDYSVTFSTEPYENWILRQIKNCERQIKNLKGDLVKAPIERNEGLNKKYFIWRIEREEKELDELRKKAEKVIK